MSVTKKLLTMAAPLALLSLGACAQPFSATVSRFQALPVPEGQTFYVQPADTRNQGGLEFSQYAADVAQHLAAKGYRPADSAQGAALVVTIGYGVDRGREKVYTTPGFGYGGFGYGGFGYGRFGYSRFGYGGLGYGGFGGGFGRWGGFGPGFGWGWDDPFWGGPDVESYTVYTSFLEMRISRTADGQRVFEGRARAHSRDDSLTHLVPNLVEAMFTGFPGNSGEDVKITIPPPPKRG